MTDEKKKTLNRTELVEQLEELARIEPSKVSKIMAMCYYPARLGKEQMKTLHTMHEEFGRKFAANLSALLQAVVEVKLTGVDELAYSEFTFGLDNPTCLNLLRVEPLKENWLLDINPAFLYPITDYLLDGGKEPTMATRRSLTDTEQQIALKVTKIILQELKSAWKNVIELEFEVIQTESDPQRLQLFPPNELVIVLCFEIIFADKRGSITLCLPYQSFESLEKMKNDFTQT